MGTCDSKTGSCEIPKSAVAEESHGCEQCGCSKECCIEQQMKKLMCAACEAKRQVMVDILKVKIQKAWGKKMELAADAVMAALEVKKDAAVKGMKAKEDLKTALQGLFKDA